MVETAWIVAQVGKRPAVLSGGEQLDGEKHDAFLFVEAYCSIFLHALLELEGNFIVFSNPIASRSDADIFQRMANVSAKQPRGVLHADVIDASRRYGQRGSDSGLPDYGRLCGGK